MRRLVLMRHATSAPAGMAGDHARPLTPRGGLEARAIGQRLVALGWTPGAALVSDALRARQTLRGLQDGLTQPLKATITQALYLTGLEAISDLILEAGDEAPSPLLIIGHNPGVSSAVGQLSGVGVGLAPADAMLLEHADARWSDAITDVGAWLLRERLTS